MNLQEPFPRVRYVGRDAQKELLLHWTINILNAARCYALYFEAEGGMGKTWLLNSYPEIIQKNSSDVRIARIVDFYDFVSRTPDGIERKLIDGLKQVGNQWYRIPSDQVTTAFEQYEQVYTGYIHAREQGAVGRGEFTPERLRETFITCWNALAEKHPLVMRFDTIEVLYGVPAPAEALVSTAEAATGHAQVLAWIQRVLPELRRTLVLFSGRPGGHSFVEQLEQLGLLAAPSQTLQPLSTPQDILAYIQAYDVGTISADDIPYVMEITEGRPLLLTCLAETRRSNIAIPPQLPLSGSTTARQEFESELVDTILNPIMRPDLAENTLVYCLHFLSYARRGIRRIDLQALFEDLGFDEYDQRVIERLDQVALVKVTRVEQEDPAGDTLASTSADEDSHELLLLHDEIHRLIDESGISGELGLREGSLAYLDRMSKQQVRQKRSARLAVLLKAMTDHMYYAMTNDIVSGHRAYVVYMDWLLNKQGIDETLVLSSVFWDVLNYCMQHGSKGIFRYQILKQKKIVLTPTYEQIIRGEQIYLVQWLLAKGQNEKAAEVAESLYEQYVNEGVLPPEDHQFSFEDVWLPEDQYLFADFSLRWAFVIHLSQPIIGDRRAEKLLTRLIDFLENRTFVHEEFLILRRLFFLGYAYLYRGYVYRQQQRYTDSISDYERGRRSFRKYREEEIVYEGQRITPETLLNDYVINGLAQVTNNLAFSLALTGNLKRARRLSGEVIKEYVPVSSEYQKALFYNTNALIHLRCGDHKVSQDSIMLAERAAKESRNARAKGLVAQAQGQIAHARMVVDGKIDPDIENYYRRATKLLENEPDTLREVYYDWADFLKDIAVLCRVNGNIDVARKYESQSLKLLNQAQERLVHKGFAMQHADILESMASLHCMTGEYDEAIKLLNQAETMMHDVMPEYGQVVSGRIALQQSIIKLYVDKDFQATLHLMAVALARMYVFAREHQNQVIVERTIRQYIWELPLEELYQFKKATESELLYVLAEDLIYQRPDYRRWTDAWERSISYINEMISEVPSGKDS